MGYRSYVCDALCRLNPNNFARSCESTRFAATIRQQLKDALGGKVESCGQDWTVIRRSQALCHERQVLKLLVYLTL